MWIMPIISDNMARCLTRAAESDIMGMWSSEGIASLRRSLRFVLAERRE